MVATGLVWLSKDQPVDVWALVELCVGTPEVSNDGGGETWVGSERGWFGLFPPPQVDRSDIGHHSHICVLQVIAGHCPFPDMLPDRIGELVVAGGRPIKPTGAVAMFSEPLWTSS